MQAPSNYISEEDGDGHRRDHHVRLERWLPFRLFTIATRVADVLNSYYGPRYGLSRASWRTMAIIANRKGVSAKEICQAAGLDQFAVSRAIGQLVELGFARRHASRTDKRYAAVELTESGWAALQDISELSRKVEGELTAGVTAKEKDVLDAVLGKLETASAGILTRGWHGLVPDETDRSIGDGTRKEGE